MGSSGSSLISGKGITLLKILSEWPAVPPVVKAKAINVLAEYAEKSGDATTCRNLETLAKDLFEQSRHAHGALDICLRQACRNIQEGVGDLDKEKELIKGYVETYEKQDFLHGEHNAIGTLSASPVSFRAPASAGPYVPRISRERWLEVILVPSLYWSSSSLVNVPWTGSQSH